MKVLGSIARALAYGLTRILPKSQTAILRGFPSYEDNLIAIYCALSVRHIDRIVWVVNDLSVEPPVPLSPNTRLVKRGSVQDFYYSMTSRFLFITHGHFLRNTPSNQICINLWHGIPFKAIGKTQGREGRSDTFLIATSDFTRNIFVQAFGTDKERIIITGQARTDRMLAVVREEIWHRAFPGTPLPKKIFFWLPTFRQTPHFEGHSDGSLFDNVFNCSDFSETAFNEALKEQNAVCLVKPHPMAARKSMADRSNIRYINEDWLLARRLSLYELVGATDCLISDVSSIIADFMLLDRPIILLFEDILAYASNRGFSFNPITDYLPANVARNFEDFMTELRAVLGDQDNYASKRAELRHLFFDHLDAGASDRILDHVMGAKRR